MPPRQVRSLTARVCAASAAQIFSVANASLPSTRPAGRASRRAIKFERTSSITVSRPVEKFLQTAFTLVGIIEKPKIAARAAKLDVEAILRATAQSHGGRAGMKGCVYIRIGILCFGSRSSHRDIRDFPEPIGEPLDRVRAVAENSLAIIDRRFNTPAERGEPLPPSLNSGRIGADVVDSKHDAYRLESRQQRREPIGIQSCGLLAKDGAQSGKLKASFEHLDVGIGRRTNAHNIRLSLCEHFASIGMGRRGSPARRETLRLAGVMVADCDKLHLGQQLAGSSMCLADVGLPSARRSRRRCFRSQ